MLAQVLAGSAAEEAGLEVGDQVASIGGTAIEDLSPSRRPWMLVRPAEGETVEVRFRRDDSPDETVSLEARHLLGVPLPADG